MLPKDSQSATNTAPSERPWQFSLLRMLVWFVTLSVILALGRAGWFAVSGAREAARRSACLGHHCQLTLALHNYHDYYGSFPPAYIVDANGKPMHSWRVLILPFVEERELYQRYNFAEPWNGPNNRQLAALMPRTFHCPSCSSPQSLGETSYVAVVGPGTAWPGTRGVPLDEVRDEKDDTLLIVEVRDAGICWLEPRDLEFDTLPMELYPRGKLGISSHHPAGVNVSTVSGQYLTLRPEEMTPARLKAMLTIAGGD